MFKRSFLYISCFIIYFTSCHNNANEQPLPSYETEFNSPVIKTLGNPTISSINPASFSLGKKRVDTISPPEVVKLGKPNESMFYSNKDKLKSPVIVVIKQPDTLFYSDKNKLPVIKTNPKTVNTEVKPVEILKTTPDLALLSFPEKITSSYPFIREEATCNIKIYSQKQGISGTVVRCMCYDHFGNLWLGTDAGLCKFDGKEWWIYNTSQGLTGNSINCIIEDKDGKLIVGLKGGGLNIIDFKDQTILHYGTNQGLISNYISSICISDGKTIFFGTEGGDLYVLQCKDNPFDQTLYKYSKAQGFYGYAINSIQIKNKSVFIGTDGDGLNILNIDHVNNRHSLRKLRTKNGLSSNNITCLNLNSSGHLMIGTKNKGLNILKSDQLGNFSINKRYTTNQGLSSDVISAIMESKNGDLCIGTLEYGLNILKKTSNLNSDDDEVWYYSAEEGLSQRGVKSILESKNGAILIGTWGGGLNILDEHRYNFRYYSKKQGLNNPYVFCIKEHENNELIIGTAGGGINILDQICNVSNNDKSKIKQYNKDQGLSSNDISSIELTNKGNIAVGTFDGGLNILNIKKNILKKFSKPQGLTSNFVIHLNKTKKGDLLISTKGAGLFVLENPEDDENIILKQYNITNNFNNNAASTTFENENGDLIIGTDGNGLMVISQDNINNKCGKQTMKQYNKDQGLSDNYIRSLLQTSNGDILIGTEGGLDIIESKTLSDSAYKNNSICSYGKEQGLIDEKIYSIKEDITGNIWLGTSKGISKLQKRQGKYVVIENFDDHNGLKYLDLNQDALFTSKNHNYVLVGVGPSLTFMEPMNIDTVISKIQITSIDVMDKKVSWLTESDATKNIITKYPLLADSHILKQKQYLTSNIKNYFTDHKIRFCEVTKDIYHLPIDLELPFDQNHLTFHFTGIFIGSNSNNIRYRYYMQGLDEQWQPITESPEADYRNIPPGKYRFKVAARSVNGYWSKPVEFAFEILPPWYQTYWAYSFYSISLLTLIFGYSHWRQSKLKNFSNQIIKIQEEEKLRISRDLHDDLGQELSFLKMNEEIKNKAAIDRVIQKVRTISYNLKPIKLLDASIKELLEDLLKSAENSSIFFSYEIEDVQINDADIKINLYRIIQEAINNIIKHSQAENARVTLTRNARNVIVEIMDDGIGINDLDLNKVNSVGVTSMKERALLMNAKFTIEGRNKGLLIKLEFKL